MDKMSLNSDHRKISNQMSDIFHCDLLGGVSAFTSYQNFTSSSLSATAAIMAHNKGLELGADMVLLLVGGGVRTEITL